MDKPTVFSMNFENVPEEMKEANRRMVAAVKRVRHAGAQYGAWAKELSAAERCLQAEQTSYAEVSLRWDPQTDTMRPALESAPPERTS